MSTFSSELLRFVGELRLAEVPVSVAETLDAMRAVAAAGFVERSRMREALAAALVKDEADRESFDEAFARFFGAGAGAAREAGRPGAHRRIAAAAGSGRGDAGASARARAERPRADAPAHGGAPPSAPPRAKSEPKAARALAPAASGKAAPRQGAAESAAEGDGVLKDAAPLGQRAAQAGASVETEEPGVDARRQAELRSARRTPFAAYTDLEYTAARDALAPLARHFRLQLGRRLHAAPRGRVDFRRTIRASLQHGGVLADLRFRSRRPRHADLLILADVSGSVRYCSALMLELVAGVYGYFRRVRSFVFIDRLAEAEFEGGHVVTEPALDLYARSDFGRVLGELWERRLELLSRTTLTVILGDGRNNRRPARADLLRDFRPLCRAVVWLTPEPAERWGTGDSAIHQYAREVDTLHRCANLDELERSLERSIRSAF
ncbi:MAG TPA: VWA domain-containing protein [Candidatus Binataceae bacterium]|nr:VWA domain-containing protein [Candidatus Binataceae bacterium]